jgi:hypothetical protein
MLRLGAGMKFATAIFVGTGSSLIDKEIDEISTMAKRQMIRHGSLQLALEIGAACGHWSSRQPFRTTTPQNATSREIAPGSNMTRLSRT